MEGRALLRLELRRLTFGIVFMVHIPPAPAPHTTLNKVGKKLLPETETNVLTAFKMNNTLPHQVQKREPTLVTFTYSTVIPYPQAKTNRKVAITTGSIFVLEDM